MNKPRTLKFFAKIDMLDWNSDVVTKVLESETTYDRFDPETIMKALNMGDLKTIPSPFVDKRAGWEIWKNLFSGDTLPWKCTNARCIESETVFNRLKFVVIDDYDNVMEWRFVKDCDKEENQ